MHLCVLPKINSVCNYKYHHDYMSALRTKNPFIDECSLHDRLTVTYAKSEKLLSQNKRELAMV